MTARLQWPDGWPRTPIEQRRRAPYKTGIGASARALEAELRLMGAENVVISTCLPTRQDGLPRASEPEPDDPGVAVYWTLGGKSHAMACDVWTRVRDNLRAVGLSIEALRGLGRWGATQVVHRAFSGFAALPAAPASRCACVQHASGHDHAFDCPLGPTWWREVLGVSTTADLAEIERAYARKAMLQHPDRGGTDEAMQNLNLAITAARRNLS